MRIIKKVLTYLVHRQEQKKRLENFQKINSVLEEILQDL